MAPNDTAYLNSQYQPLSEAPIGFQGTAKRFCSTSAPAVRNAVRTAERMPSQPRTRSAWLSFCSHSLVSTYTHHCLCYECMRTSIYKNLRTLLVNSVIVDHLVQSCPSTPLQSQRILNQRGSWVLVAQGSVSTNRGKQAHQRDRKSVV